MSRKIVQLSIKYPKLCKDWDYEKNGDLRPENVSYGSDKKVIWKCHKCGYTWEAKISNRVHGRGCPACGGKVVIPGRNDLLTTHPEIAAEWDYVKNKDINPSEVSHGCGKDVWWICPKGHSYHTTINHRTSKDGTGCPVCNSQRQTSFAEQAFYYYIKKMYPDTISRYKSPALKRFEIDIYIPSIKYAIEYDGVAWHKANKMEREIRKYQLCKQNGITLFRIREGKKPAYSNLICDEIFCLENMHKHSLLERVIIYLLNGIKPITFEDMFGQKNDSDLLNMNPFDVDVERDRFEILKYLTNDVENSIIKVRPEIASEWHPTKNGTVKPEYVKAGSTIKYWWKCRYCGNEFQMTPARRKSGSGCPKCAIEFQKNHARMNRVRKYGGIKNPLLLKEWDYKMNGDKKPENFTRSSEVSVWWKCSKCGYVYKARISNREHGKNCPACANRVAVKGLNDLKTKFPGIAKEWDYEKNYPLTPEEVVPGYNKKVWWICPNGHSYQAPPNRRTSTLSGCRKCADKENAINTRKRAILKNGTLAEKHPELLDEYSSKNKIRANEISCNSHEKVWWICSKCGYEWLAAPYTRVKEHGCNICGQKKALETRRKKKLEKQNI